ncbi:MAG: hypothetical protein ABUT20_19305, partial [Bacteroidota bacterium]
IERVDPDAVLYSYKITLPTEKTNDAINEIYFGDKKVGILRSLNPGTEGTFSGKLEIKKSFPLYSHSDFFMLTVSGKPKIEVRIDPTREKKPLDPLKDIICINVR